jgi:tetratricopeptide (TPR) repeat protein
MSVRSTALVLAVIVILCAFSPARAAVSRDEVLDRGLTNLEPYSYSLAMKARAAGKEEKRELLAEAITVSPDLPALYFSMAWAHFPNVFRSGDYVLEGFKAYGRNFRWTVSLAGLAYVSLLLSLVTALAVVCLVRFPLALALLVHDINERKAKLLLPLVALPLAALGPLGFMTGCLFLTGFYLKKGGKALFYVAGIFMLLSPLLTLLANTYFSAGAPKMRAMAAVSEERDSAYALQILERSEKRDERFSYALALKRKGRAREAVDIISRLAREEPGADVYTNLGNAYITLDRHDDAKRAYETALEHGRSAITLYNLSQVYRDELNYPVGDKYYDEALAEDRALVTGFTPRAGKTPNRLVVDMTFGWRKLWSLISEYRRDMVSLYPVSPYIASAAAVLFLLLFSVADKGMKNRAFRCSRCGGVSCPVCNGGKKIRGDVCIACYAKQASKGESPRTRVARMLAETERKNKLMARMRLLSFAPPGIAQLYAGKAFGGFLYVWLFVFALVMIVANPLFSTGMGPFSHSWLTPALVLFLIGLYAVSTVSINRRITQGWL